MVTKFPFFIAVIAIAEMFCFYKSEEIHCYWVTYLLIYKLILNVDCKFLQIFPLRKLLKFCQGKFRLKFCLKKRSRKTNHTFWYVWPWDFKFHVWKMSCLYFIIRSWPTQYMYWVGHVQININCKKFIIIIWKKSTKMHLPCIMGPSKWRVTVSGELRFMTSYLES